MFSGNQFQNFLIHNTLKAYWGMKLIFDVYLDINRGNNLSKFIKSGLV